MRIGDPTPDCRFLTRDDRHISIGAMLSSVNPEIVTSLDCTPISQGQARYKSACLRLLKENTSIRLCTLPKGAETLRRLHKIPDPVPPFQHSNFL